MQFDAGNFYHIFNRGINRKRIFFSKRNYEFFLEKVEINILPHCSLVSYCLMPNHFHLLIHANERTGMQVHNRSILPVNNLGEGIRVLLSSYALAINKQQSRTGNLFQQKTKSTCLSAKGIYPGVLSDSSLYEEDCFHSIHFNPVKAGLVENPGDWEFSSYREYFSFSQKNLCNTEIGKQFLRLEVMK